MNRCLLALAVSQVLFHHAVAQDSAPPKVVLQLRPGTECITTMKYPNLQTAGMKPPPMPETRTFLFTGTDGSRFTKMTDNRTLSEHVRGNYYLAWDSKTGPQIGILGDDGVPADFRAEHFPELGWLSGATFKGVEKRGPTKFYLFEGTEGQKLFVDMPTLLPVILESAEVNSTFAYRDTGLAGTKIAIPPELQARWDKVRAAALKYHRVKIEE